MIAPTGEDHRVLGDPRQILLHGVEVFVDEALDDQRVERGDAGRQLVEGREVP